MKVTREHKALVLFFALALAGLGFAYFYITSLGHSWNIAASAIDDMSGELRGYTVILYEGTVSEDESDKKQDNALSSFELKFVDDLNKNSEARSSSEEAVDLEVDLNESVFDLPALKRSYAQKGASVFVLQLDNPSLYLEKTIVLGGGGNSFGIMTVDQEHCSKAYIQKRIEEYKQSGVDLIIAITTSYDLITDYSGIDAVFSVSEEGLSDTGVTSDGVFYKDATKQGSISAIIVSQSRVFSGKEMSSF